jgi:exodeoxyribonuclease VII small subunit
MTTPSFEKLMEQLQTIVKKLESGDLSLEDSVLEFETGMQLSKQCSDQLIVAEQKVEVLIKAAAERVETQKLSANA